MHELQIHANVKKALGFFDCYTPLCFDYLFSLCCLDLYSFSFYLKITFNYFKVRVCGCSHEFWCQQRPEEDDRGTGAGAAGDV